MILTMNSGRSLWQAFLFRLINFWPPFIGAGIRLKRISQDFQEAHVEMKLRFWNKNYVGVHFGGSLYAMTDPFFMLLAIEQFRREGWLKDYVIWDKAARIQFKRPGKGRVTAHFTLSRDQASELKKHADTSGKHDQTFTVNILDESGQIVAEVEKTLYIRKLKSH
jgi:hypothetical protein